MYIADSHNCLIRKVTVSTGIITTIAGSVYAYCDYYGDGGQATSARLHTPYGVALDSSGAIKVLLNYFILFLHYFFNIGNVYIADSYNYRIRKVTVSTEIITTIAGTGAKTYNGDDIQATSASLDLPLGVALNSAGSSYYNLP